MVLLLLLLLLDTVPDSPALQGTREVAGVSGEEDLALRTSSKNCPKWSLPAPPWWAWPLRTRPASSPHTPTSCPHLAGLQAAFKEATPLPTSRFPPPSLCTGFTLCGELLFLLFRLINYPGSKIQLMIQVNLFVGSEQE